MTIKHTALSLLAASALFLSAAPALANEPTSYWGNGSGSLFVFVQVNAAPQTYFWRAPSDFTLSVTGNAYPATVQGSQNAQMVSVNGSYKVNAANFSGYTASYSNGCSGTLGAGQYATCVVSETPLNNGSYYNNTQQPIVYVTPQYVPRFPNTGLEPMDGAAIAFALALIIAAGFMVAPYVRKAFAITLR